MTITGKEIVRLMRAHKVTIRELARRVGTTMKRVREVRAGGDLSPLAALDWRQAITGVNPTRDELRAAAPHLFDGEGGGVTIVSPDGREVVIETKPAGGFWFNSPEHGRIWVRVFENVADDEK